MTDSDQGLQLDGFDLAAILFALKALLCLLVIVQFALDPLDSAVEGVDGGPHDLVESWAYMGCSVGWTATVAAFMATKAHGRSGLAARALCEGLDGRVRLICFAP